MCCDRKKQYCRTAGKHSSFAERHGCNCDCCSQQNKEYQQALSRESDIVIAALGSPGFVKAEMVKEGAVVIDVGTTRVVAPGTKTGFRLAGDVDFENVAPRCSYITPVPGGVGPMTRVSLLRNTLVAVKNRK